MPSTFMGSLREGVLRGVYNPLEPPSLKDPIRLCRVQGLGLKG